MSGTFVALEGADGCGKSTQAALLVERLQARGRAAVGTFEPGATTLGREIRQLVLGHDAGNVIDARAEALLIAADRAQHVAEVVRPALARGEIVVSDRYIPSSLAYQGRGRALGVEAVERLNEWATGGLVPDVVVVLDVDGDELTRRRPEPLDRLEREHRDFHDAVRRAYAELAAARGWVVVDGSEPAERVADKVWAAVEPFVR